MKTIKSITLESTVVHDENTKAVARKFDYGFDGKTTTVINVPDFPNDFSIGLIVGSSGSGKSTLLRNCFGNEESIVWDNSKAIISHFESPDEGIQKLSAVGLSSIPSWCKPYSVLSTGEKFRADLARRIKDGAAVDEFTSVVNRDAAKATSFAVQKYIRSAGIKRVVFASCHDDIIDYLLPDWIYDTDKSDFYNGRYLQRPPIRIEFRRCAVNEWNMFKIHHYLSGDINKACRCYLAEINERPVAFVGVLSFPSGGIKNAWRESRLVVLPDFQGIGIGNAVSEAIAQAYVDSGCRYYSKTTNPKCGEHRDNSPLWRPTSHNHKKRSDYIKNGQPRSNRRYSMSAEMQVIHSNRTCYSHEYIGKKKNRSVCDDGEKNDGNDNSLP